jgi:exopolysaccharide biosynthesis polyprenyl glycosylphosphotransferase
LFSDLISLTVAFSLAVGFEFGTLEFHATGFSEFFFLCFGVFPVVFYLFDLYYPFKFFARLQTLVDLFIALVTGTVVMASMSYLDRSFTAPRQVFAYAVIFLFPLTWITRLLYDAIFAGRFMNKKTVVLGTGPLAKEIASLIRSTPNSGMDLIGLVYEKHKPGAKNVNGLPILGGSHQLISILDWHGVQLVVLALDEREDESEMVAMSELLKRHVQVTSALHLYENISGEIPFPFVGPYYLLGLMSQVRTRPYLKLKRLMDLVFGFLLLLILGPVLLASILASTLTQKGRVFFVQKRIGLNGRPFRLLKLRTMTEGPGGKMKITALGRWLRRYRIDEIPQLMNVLKGDMSLVGPRPEIAYFVDRCRKKIPFFDAVFSLKPGLTGWAQVKFRYTVSVKDYNKKFRYNLYYLKNISLTLDLLILLRTIRVILLGKGR